MSRLTEAWRKISRYENKGSAVELPGYETLPAIPGGRGAFWTVDGKHRKKLIVAEFDGLLAMESAVLIDDEFTVKPNMESMEFEQLHQNPDSTFTCITLERLSFLELGPGCPTRPNRYLHSGSRRDPNTYYRHEKNITQAEGERRLREHYHEFVNDMKNGGALIPSAN